MVKSFYRKAKAAKAEEARRQRGLVGTQVGPEDIEAVQAKLDPRKFSGMGGKFIAIVAYIIDLHGLTDPEIDEMAVTSDGLVLASASNGVGMNTIVGTIDDLERNWEEYLEAADLTFEERATAERLYMVKVEDHRVTL